MATDWLNGFIVPIIELTFVGGIILTILFIVIRALRKVYLTKWLWFLKYSVLRNKYDPKTVQWVMDAIDKGMDYWESKKFLMMSKDFPHIITQDHINEVMWVYTKIFKQLQGGIKDGQRIARSH